MATLLEETQTETETENSPAERLQTTMCATRISFVWFGTRKSLSAMQKAQAAESFGAAGEYLSAGKKLLDTRHPRFKAVNSVRSRVRAFWNSISLPYPEPGIRLVRRESLESFQEQLSEYREELNETVSELEEQYETLRSSARERLGELYQESDYPASLRNLFAINWEFPSVEPPSYLQQLNPELYQQQCQRVQARFEEAVQLAESAFVEELSNLVSHLTDRLSGQGDGRPKIFRDSAISNLQEFFDRFRLLNIRSNEQMEELVTTCQQIVSGIAPQQLRSNGGLRKEVASQLSGVQSVLDGLLIDRPRRSIIRTPK